ncbi:MAG: hypothetical protein J0H08_01055 [Rhizobiales bacterium]|nr:hypothetical protein [Hyphomicrobiales bacterium]
MGAELGHFALILALALALAQSVIPFVGAMRGDTRLMAVAGPAAVTQFLLIGIAFALLVNAYVLSDFSVLNVAENSHSAKPLQCQSSSPSEGRLYRVFPYSRLA